MKHVVANYRDDFFYYAGKVKRNPKKVSNLSGRDIVSAR